MLLYTIGFAGKSARDFFTLLKDAGVRKVIDIRLYNTSQLAGYAKKQDLKYLLQAIVSADYIHLPIMAPTGDLLNGYKKGSIDWSQYEKQFNDLIVQRRIENALPPDQMDHACLLCSEANPSYCHRRLVAEYLAKKWNHAEICHL